MAQSDAYRRNWLQQRGSGDSRLTCKQNQELKVWFEFWDRDSEGAVDPRSISDALFSLDVLSEEQRQELDALIEAATDGDESHKFNYAEFRTLMTYPKCGIGKTVLKVMAGADFLENQQKIPFHITVQAYNREKLISGLMGSGAKRKESEKRLAIAENKLQRKELQRQAKERDKIETKRAKSPAKPEAQATLLPIETKPNPEDSANRFRHSNRNVPLHSKVLFKISLPREMTKMQFSPMDFFPQGTD